MITKIADVPHLVPKGRADPKAAFPEIRLLAASGSWQEREVAATALVEISKKQADVAELLRWARDPEPNVRRAASEGLRDLARTTPDAVVPVLELLRADPALYVRKSVANVLRNAGKRHPGFVLDICRRWAKVGDPPTDWVVKDGLRKLRESEPEQVERVVSSLGKR